MVAIADPAPSIRQHLSLLVASKG